MSLREVGRRGFIFIHFPEEERNIPRDFVTHSRECWSVAKLISNQITPILKLWPNVLLMYDPKSLFIRSADLCPLWSWLSGDSAWAHIDFRTVIPGLRRQDPWKRRGCFVLLVVVFLGSTPVITFKCREAISSKLVTEMDLFFFPPCFSGAVGQSLCQRGKGASIPEDLPCQRRESRADGSWHVEGTLEEPWPWAGFLSRNLGSLPYRAAQRSLMSWPRTSGLVAKGQ